MFGLANYLPVLFVICKLLVYHITVQNQKLVIKET